MMSAPKGNRFWEARSKSGRDKIFSTPDSLWASACEYFEWVESNPLYEDKVSFYQGVATHEPIAHMRAMTISGFCLFVGCDVQTLNNYGSSEGYEDFFGVVNNIKKVIYEQKFTGAAADMLNPNIIARDLGLKEKSELDLSSSDGSMSPKAPVYKIVDE